jgi:hypothetical protein
VSEAGAALAAQLSDDFPVLLGPVRVETRFTATELLVRMFPDDWAVDAFEPRPTAAEVAALDAYWTALWRAGGEPSVSDAGANAERGHPLVPARASIAERAAWQELTGRVPAGRASWLLQGRRPANPGDRPTGVPAGTTVLVVGTAQPVAATDREPTVTYWTAIWRAHGDRRAIRAADRALLTAVGPDRAATVRSRRPAGVDTAAVHPGDGVTGDEVRVAFLVLPPPDAADLAPQSWTRAARARLLPDRFTVLGYADGQQVVSATGADVPDTLAVSPDPGATDQLSVDEQTAALHVPDDLRWLTDFDRAVQVGMGLRIPLDDRIRGGLDRLVVLGLRQRSGPDQAGAELAELLTRQLRSPAGFSLLPQGTPTNNTEQAPAGQDETQQAEAVPQAGAAVRTASSAAAVSAGDWTAKTDGQWFAELLGVDPAALAGVPNADRTDQRDARAANLALWPATWGYYLATMLHPVLGPDAVERTRQFFTRYVSGRGPVPAVQIGRQPYGILPTTAFSRLAWPDAGPVPAGHRRAVAQVLRAATDDWRAASAKVARLGTTGDPHQLLLDILALHPTSAEFYQRYAQSVEDIYNRENLGSRGPTVLPALDQLHMPQPVRALLARLGHPGPPTRPDPDLVRRLFAGTQHPLLGPLVDDRPLSETDPVREYTTDHRSYLRWLADLAGTDLNTLRLERGFAADRPPAALLYLLLRHAVLLGWADAARRLAIAAGSPQAPSPADPLFVHIGLGDPAAPSESRFRQLYSPDQAVTGDPDTLLVDFIPTALAGQDGQDATAPLAAQVQALDLLADLPTARLERVLVEHLDCATYRLDAWQLGLATERLAELRFGPGGGAPARRGVHLGAYGWLEDVRPRTTQLTPVRLTGQLGQIFTPPGSAPLLHDPANGGFVHAPSPGQATTAAVLRAGYLANATPDNPGSFAVNLSSDRVRVALTILDGLRQGQSLGALLGYRFERGLHDRFAEAELDSLIVALRGAFPLRAGRLPGTEPAPGIPVELVEARNVVDGLDLVRRVTRTPDSSYPFGVAGLPPADPAQLAAIDAEVQRLLEIHDAVADLAVAESTHQALAGNAERAAATLDAFAKGDFPLDPAVVRTPRSGVTLTHRFGLQFTPGLHPPAGGSPRAQAEPAVDDWLSGLLPDRNDVAVLVTWTDPVTGQARSRVVTQHDVDVAPIDLLWAVRPAGAAAMTDLDDRIVRVVADRDQPRPDAPLAIRYTQRIDNKITFFELSSLVAALRTMLTTSRSLRPSDLVPAAGPAAVDRTEDEAVSLPRERPAAVRNALDDLREGVADYLADLSPLLPDPPAPPRRAELVSGIDTFLRRYAELAVTAGGFGLVRSGWGELTAWRRGVFGDVLAAVAETAERMGGSLAAADALIAEYDALGPAASDEVRFRLLQQAEQLLTTTPTSPRPDRPSRLRAIVRDLRQAFNNRLQALRREAETIQTTLSGLLAEVAAQLPLTDIDRTGLDLTPFQDRVVAFAADLRGRAGALQTEILRRLAAADAALADYDAAVTGPDRVGAGTGALAALLGEDVLVVGEFTPTDQLAADLRKARADSAALVQHLVDDAGRDFPVDDWLHGIARVREMPRLWERVVLLSDALRGRGGLLADPPRQDPELVPIQLPYRQHDHWLGMEFAAGTEITEDRLLYTAHYASDPPPAQHNRCGLLLDEWTEVVPAERETTGIAAGVDRPDSEPPQAMLLVVPPVRTGAWSFGDLVAAIAETYELAKLRAVEPEHLDDTAYAQLLPATILSATRRPITISTDLAIANLRWKAREAP